MAGLMVGYDALFFVRDQSVLSFGSHYNTLNSLFQFGLPNGLLIAARCQNSAFIDQVLQIRADEARRTARQRREVNSRIQWLALHMNFKDRFASFDIRAVKSHASVKAAGT